MSFSQCFISSRLFPAFKSSIPVLQLGGSTTTIFRQNNRSYRTINVNSSEVVNDLSKFENELSKNTIAKVNDQITKKSHGRLFAVVYISGLQFKVTTEDIIVIRSYWAPTIGDRIRLEKVLLLGASDFTLIGRPLLPLDQVLVLGTVIEKTLTHSFPKFFYRPRSNIMKLNFLKSELTYLRITDISLCGKVNELGDTDGLKNRIF